jgi:hypothetical protein
MELFCSTEVDQQVRPAVERTHAATWKALERTVFLRDWQPDCCVTHAHVALHSLRGSDPVVDHEWQQLEKNYYS